MSKETLAEIISRMRRGEIRMHPDAVQRFGIATGAIGDADSEQLCEISLPGGVSVVADATVPLGEELVLDADDVTLGRIRALESERDALRSALIHVADLQLRRYEDAQHVRAYRHVANLHAPFSDEQVTQRLEEMRAGMERVYEAACAMVDAHRESHDEWVRATDAVHEAVHVARTPR